MVDCLLDHGADVNAEDVCLHITLHACGISYLFILQSEQWTGLILSSRKGNLQIVKKLLDRGADVNKETNVSYAQHWHNIIENFAFTLDLMGWCDVGS